MELEVRDREKRVNIWLTHAESQDAGFMEALKPIYRIGMPWKLRLKYFPF